MMGEYLYANDNTNQTKISEENRICQYPGEVQQVNIYIFINEVVFSIDINENLATDKSNDMLYDLIPTSQSTETYRILVCHNDANNLWNHEIEKYGRPNFPNSNVFKQIAYQYAPN